jgi:exoribonuclease-2
MHVLFEEDGAFKAATIVTDNDSSLQVETVSGKRSKIKATNVLLRYSEPAPTALLDQAEVLASEIEPDFLWECLGDDEFSFPDFASEYFGHTGTAVETAALLWPCIRRQSISTARARDVSARLRPKFSRRPSPVLKKNASKL